MRDAPRVAIVAHRFTCPGGIQTCFIELIAGLNEIGIVPETVWDEPQDWGVLGRPRIQVTYGGGRLKISSERLRSLPSWLSSRLRPLSVRAARFALDRYDFVYSFEPGVRMPAGKPNLCFGVGPPFLRMPEERIVWKNILGRNEIRKLIHLLSTPAVRPDRNSHYATLSEWIADLFKRHYGFRPSVIWPPARSRSLAPAPGHRSGFLFLSRLQEYKRAESMLAIARAYPGQVVTVSGVALAADKAYIACLRERIREENLSNVRIVENPPEDKVATLFGSHAFFVFPARWEHFGIVTVEAIKAGLLPLVHDTGGQKEIVPSADLRFQTDDQLIACAKRVMEMSADKKQQLVLSLQRHTRRGSAGHFREEMIRPLKLLMDRA